jgi:glutaredoxin
VQTDTLPDQKQSQARVFSPEEVAGIEMFKRSSPPCSYCFQAKQIITSRFPEADLVEYDMLLNAELWKQFNKDHKGITSVPQITFILKEGGERVFIGGFSELLQAVR